MTPKAGLKFLVQNFHARHKLSQLLQQLRTVLIGRCLSIEVKQLLFWLEVWNWELLPVQLFGFPEELENL